MIRLSWWSLILVVCFPVTLGASTLAVGEAVDGSLEPGQTRTFTFSIPEARYLRLRLDQEGVDAALYLHDPGGGLVAEADGPGGRWVEETLSVVTRAAGTYRLEITAAGTDTNAAGRYRLVLQEIRVATTADVHRLRADALHHQGRHLRQLPPDEHRRAALDAFEQAATAYRQAADARGEADALDQIGGIHLLSGATETARELYERALPLYEAAGHRPGQADVENDLGLALARLGEDAAAQERLLRGLELWREIGDAGGQAMSLYSLGDFHFRRGDLPAARTRFEEALVQYRAAGDHPGEARALTYLTAIRSRMGDLAGSIDAYHQALELTRESGDRSQESLLLFNIATLHKALGELQEALDGYRRARASARELGRRDIEEEALGELAETYRVLGRPQEALELLDPVLARDHGTRSENAWILMTAGWAYTDLERWSEARAHLQRALAISRAEKARQTELQSLRGLARSHRAEGQPSAALAFQQEALVVARDLDDPIAEGDVLRELGMIELEAGRPQRAPNLLRQALEKGREAADPVREAMIHSGLARAEHAFGRIDAALAEIETALALADKVRAAVVAPELRAAFRARRFQDHEFHVTLLLELAARSGRSSESRALQEAAFAASERARARGLVELLTEAGIDARAGLDPELATREHAASRQLSGVQSRLIRELSATERDEQRLALLRRGLAAARAERELVAEEIRRRHPRYATLRYPKPLGVREVQPLLEDGTAFLEYSLGEERSFVFVLTRDRFAVHELGPALKIATAVEQFRAAAARRPSRRLQGRLNQAAQSLHEQLIVPAASTLEGFKKLVIAPDRELHHLPFEALRSPGDPLLARYTVSYVPSASVLAHLAKMDTDASTNRSSTSHFVGIAQPLDEAAPGPAEVLTRVGELFEAWSWRPLPGAADEVRSIARLFPGAATTWIGGTAGEDKLKSDPAVARARILHVAAHGLVDDREPAYSGLLLGATAGSAEDGILQVHEIFDLRLDADLVVLSACETGLGERLRGEGILGLARAFFYAGSRSLVVSLWPAADAATSELMQAFYRHLQDGRSRAEALTAAKRELLAHGGTSHPFYWAPFVLVGQP